MTSKSPLDLEFATQSLKISLDEHFPMFKQVLKVFDETLNNCVLSMPEESVKDFETQLPHLLHDPNDPLRIEEEISVHNDIFKKNMMLFVNKYCENSKLKTLETRQAFVQKTPQIFNFQRKWRNYIFLPSPSKISGGKPPKEKPPDTNHVICCIKIYKPIAENCKGIFRICQEFEIDSKASLANFKDAIRCNLDFCGLDDVSKDVKAKEIPECIPSSQKVYPSAFFLLNDTFYSDDRAGCHDLTTEIRDWFKSTRRTNRFQAKYMSNVKFEDLNITIGRPYLYQHQGSCEHIFIVSDLRFKCFDDRTLPEVPCAVRAVGNLMSKHCLLCTTSQVHWLVKGFPKLTVSTGYFCHRCFVSFCYIDGRKVADFKAYRFVDQSVAVFH